MTTTDKTMIEAADLTKEEEGTVAPSRGAGRVVIHPHVVQAVLLFAAFMLIWELGVGLLDVPSIVLPPPSAIAVSLWRSILADDFAWHAATTLYEATGGFFIGLIIGLPLGALIGTSPLLERLFYPYAVALQMIPKVALAPLIIVWFGYGPPSKIVLTATITFFPILANTIAGLRATPGDEIELMAAFTASRWQVFREVRLPRALPFIFVSLDLALGLSIIGAIIGEFVGSQSGIGYLILQKNFNFDIAGEFGLLIVISLAGIILHWAITKLEKRVVFWIDRPLERVAAG